MAAPSPVATARLFSIVSNTVAARTELVAPAPAAVCAHTSTS